MALLFVILIFVPWTANAANKTKRSHELYNYGEPNPVLIYGDNLGSHSSADLPNTYSNYRPLTLVPVPQPQTIKIYNPPSTAKESGQQVLYAYQQTPSNVMHAKQSFQPVNNFNQHVLNPHTQFQKSETSMPPPTNIFHNIAPAETIILPVQQQQQQQSPTLPDNNGQLYSNTKPNNLFSTQPHVPRRYFYVNGKVLFDSNQAHLPLQNMNQQPPITASLFSNQQRHNYYQQKPLRPPIIDYVNRNHFPRQQLISQGNISPVSYNKVTSLPKVPLQPIKVAQKSPLKKDEENEQADEDNVSTKDNDETDIPSDEKFNDEENLRENERNPIFGKYSFDDEENEDSDRDTREEEEDDEEDNGRDSTKYTNQKKRSKTEKINTDNHGSKYKFSDKENKYDYAKIKSGIKTNRKPKTVSKSTKFSREKSSPKTDSLEGRYSENLPVTHKHNIFKERWYISKNINDNVKTY